MSDKERIEKLESEVAELKEVLCYVLKHIRRDGSIDFGVISGREFADKIVEKWENQKWNTLFKA